MKTEPTHRKTESAGYEHHLYPGRAPMAMEATCTDDLSGIAALLLAQVSRHHRF